MYIKAKSSAGNVCFSALLVKTFCRIADKVAGVSRPFASLCLSVGQESGGVVAAVFAVPM